MIELSAGNVIDLSIDKSQPRNNRLKITRSDYRALITDNNANRSNTHTHTHFSVSFPLVAILIELSFQNVTLVTRRAYLFTKIAVFYLAESVSIYIILSSLPV